MHALTLLLSPLFAALLIAGCQHPAAAPPPDLLRARTGEGCGPDLRDKGCVACMKAHCCAEMSACGTIERCSCSVACMRAGNDDRACAARCAGAEDRALGLCGFDRCGDICGGAP